MKCKGYDDPILRVAAWAKVASYFCLPENLLYFSVASLLEYHLMPL